MVFFSLSDGAGVLQLCSSHIFKEALSFGDKKQKEEGLCQGDEVQARPDDPLL